LANEGEFNLKEIIEFLKLSRPTGEPIFYKDWTNYKYEDIDLSVYRKDDFRCELHWQKVKLHETEASQFLSFAKQDIEDDSEKGRANALSNANKAIACRIDEFLKLSNFDDYSHRWNLHLDKMLVLQTFGVPVPDMLKRLIRRKRNLLEHKYEIPKEWQEIQDAVELATLFLEATRAYVERGYIASSIVTYTAWFKEEVTPSYEYDIGYSTQYKIEFDLNKAITLLYSDKEVSRRRDLNTGEIRMEWESVIKEKGPLTMPIRECKMEEVKELMILLRERGREV
jgi:hypothetical protein